MDPQLPASFHHKTANLSTGRTYHYVDQLPVAYDGEKHPTFLAIHGFPDSWYGWRYQIRPWVQSGYRVIVPDMLGYGGTDKPKDAQEYSTKRLCADLAALLDSLSIKQAVIIGHDWGSFTAARFALWHPDRLLALVLISIPYTPPSKTYISVQEIARRLPTLAYQAYFNESESTKQIEEDLDRFLSNVFTPPQNKTISDILLRGPHSRNRPSSLLTQKEMDYYLSQFKQGMNGPLNYYRTAKFRHDEELAAGLPSSLRSDLPVLYLWGTADSTSNPSSSKKASKFIARLREVAFEGKGHWVMVEAKEEITNEVIAWLESLSIRAPTRSKL